MGSRDSSHSSRSSMESRHLVMVLLSWVMAKPRAITLSVRSVVWWWFFWSCATYAVMSCQSSMGIWYFFAVLVFVASSLVRNSARVNRTRVVSVGFPVVSATLLFKGAERTHLICVQVMCFLRE